MRPIRIEMTNFGPFRQEVVDFSAFDDSSLFLISGRTGAGKSSIFDAMTYALFNTTSSDREISEMRSTFATLKDPRTRVVFYFEHHNHIYRVERELDLKPRLGIDRGQGIGTKDASLSVVDGVGGLELEKLATKSTPTTDAIEDLLQLKSDQFKQIILLPQYQFSTFLKAPTNEKVPMLRQIFGTQIFEQFEKALSQKWSQSNQEQGQLATQLANLYQSQIWTQEAREHFEGQSDQERWSLAQSYLAAITDDLTKCTQTYQAADKGEKSAQKAYQKAQALAAKFEELSQKKSQYQLEVQHQESTYQYKREQQAQLKFAAGLKDDWVEKNRIAKTLKDLAQSIDHLSEQVADQEAGLSPLKASVADLLSQEATQQEAHNSLSQLNQALTSAQDLAKHQKALAALQQQAEAQAQRLLELNQQEAGLLAEQEKLADQALTDEVVERSKQALDWVTNHVTYQLTPLLEKKEQLSLSQKDLADSLAKLELILEAQSQELTEAKVQLAAKKANQNRLMIAKLQADLVDGEPCPVCGSLEHPLVETQLDTGQLIALLAQVDQLESQVNQLKQEHQAKTLEKAHLTEKQAECQLDIEQAKQAMSQELATLNAYLQREGLAYPSLTTYTKTDGHKLLEELSKSYQEKLDQQEAQQQSLKRLQQELATLTADKQTSNLQQSSLAGQMKTLSTSIQQIDQAYPELETEAYYTMAIADIQAAYQQYRQTLQDKQQQLAQAQERLSGLQGQLTSHIDHQRAEQDRFASLSERLATALASPDAKTQDPVQLADWIGAIEQGQLDGLSQWISAYEEKRQLLKNDLDQLSQELADQDQPDLPAADQALSQAQERRNKALEDLTTIKHQQEQTSQLVQAIQELRANSSQKQEQFSQLTSLKTIISGGEKGQQRLKLETYIIQEHLEEILAYANDHYIGLLSDQQFEFVLSDRQQGNRQSGLDIAIYNRLTNKEMPASSLSGGETFIASLAIALSMSEVVQNASNGALIEALFIDEGFGSLDEATLDKAIAVLEKIGQNRMVGVISHVKEMKDTISHKLLISKTLDGSSHITLSSD